jgi:hypothetical protein
MLMTRYLGNSANADRLMIELFKYFVEVFLEYTLYDLFGVTESVRFSIRVKLAESLAEERREQVRSRPSPLGELQLERESMAIHKQFCITNLDKCRACCCHLLHQEPVPPYSSPAVTVQAPLR